MSLPRVEPDTKDWTWVLREPCPDCRFVAADVPVEALAEALRANAGAWPAHLAGPHARTRPRPDVWSPLEYACHVRDVHRVFDERVRLMVEEDEPRFANWDQDETAVESRYAQQDPAVVAEELVDAAAVVARRYAAVAGDTWQRRGFRSDGSEFTVASLGRYHLHDVVHHAHDVAVAAKAATVAAYDASASAYRDGSVTMPATVDEVLRRFAARLPDGARVLEVGSGPGRDALALEALGVSVRRTDVSPGFVELMRSAGHRAELLDPATDDLADPERRGAAYDGVWASACLLHVARADLPLVLGRLAEATRPGGTLHVSLKEGDGEVWSTHGNVAAPRLFVLWREEPLRRVLEGAGWSVDELRRHDGLRGDRWLGVLATRKDA
ncbi:class I SAM-dependent methyltransferase [Nocardioides sp. MAHUQ-72]|uniref:class I SAM-dependent methyltransferase n=1 Tax=unclassified Nocardioides TaxID=2615069 RepID=UPI003618970D